MWIGKGCGMKMKVKENDKNFKLQSTSTLKTFEICKIKETGLVIYFYQDNTPGCTLETKRFFNTL